VNRAQTVQLLLRRSPAITVGVGVVAAFAAGLAATQWLGLAPWVLLVPLVGLAYAAWVVHRPVAGLFVVICIFFLPVRIGGVTLLQLVGVATGGLITLWFLLQRRELRLGRVLLPLSLIGVMLVTSLLFTRDVGRTVGYLRIWVFNMFFVTLLCNLITTFEVFRRVVWAVILMAALNAAVGVYDFAHSSEQFFRSAGMLENANEFGNLAALAFPLALFQFLYRRGTLRWVGLALCAVCAAGVVVSVSRGALIAMIVVFLLVCVTERRKLPALLLVAGLALGSVPLLPGYFFQRVSNLVSEIRGTVVLTDSSQLTTRGYYNQGALRVFLAHPVLGVGIGNFGSYFVEHKYNPLAKSATTGVSAHNIYLQALAETGLVGFANLIWLIAITLSNVFRARAASRGDVTRWLYFGGTEMMALTVLITTFSSGNLMYEEFWLLVGLTAVSAQVAVAGSPARDGGLPA